MIIGIILIISLFIITFILAYETFERQNNIVFSDAICFAIILLLFELTIMH